jgi:hypothetical protein
MEREYVNVLQILWHTHTATKGRTGRASREEMLKMQIDPAILLKTKDAMTKCPRKSRTFTAIERHIERHFVFTTTEMAWKKRSSGESQ